MFCSHCGYKLGDGMRVCPKCGTVAEEATIIAENVEIVENAEIVENTGGYVTKAVKNTGTALRKAHQEYRMAPEEYPGTVKKRKKKLYMVLIVIVIVVAGGMASSSYRQYRNNVEELQTYMEQGLIDEARDKADSMPKWQTQKAFDKINHDIQSESNTYVNKKAYDADFYGNLEGKVLVLHEMEELDEPTIKSMPDLQYCYQEAIQNDELNIVEGYLSFLQEIQADYDVSIEDKISLAQEVRTSYENAKHKYESGSYQEAMDICQKIVPDESDLVYIESVAVLLSDIETAYTNVIEENMQRAIENEDYTAIYQYIKTAKEGSSDNEKYTEMENQYLDGAIKAIKSEISYQDYDSAYATCKAVAECVPDNDDFVNLFAETVQEYAKYLLSYGDFDTAQEIMAEGLDIFPENKALTTLQAQLENDTWRLLYDAFLADLYTETDTIEFTLYPVNELDVPYLLVVTGNQYEFYQYNDNRKSVEMVANSKFDTYLPTEGLFFRYGDTLDKGYFSNTTTESWEGYSFNGTEFVSEYILQKIVELHYEAFTNRTLSRDEWYMRDNDRISEAEYNKQIKKIEEASGMTTYSYNEDNIKAIIYNN